MTYAALDPTPRTTLGRRAERGRYDRATIDTILDEALVCHVALAVDGQPVVLPTTYVRLGDRLFIHGSIANRWLGRLRDGLPCCVTVTLLDGLVLSRSAFHMSMNYRSVVVFGPARAVAEDADKRRVLEALVEKLVRGRSAVVRPPTDGELAATTVLELPIAEASAKVRAGGPIEAPDDLALPVWGGEVPIRMTMLDPVADANVREGVRPPPRETYSRTGGGSLARPA